MTDSSTPIIDSLTKPKKKSRLDTDKDVSELLGVLK
jgi:hypothetical protein